MSFSDLVSEMDDKINGSFGETVTWNLSAGGTEELTGVFSETYTAVDPDSGVAVQSVQPNLFVKLSDLPDGYSLENDTLTISGATYKVDESRVDGEGTTTLFLKKA